MKNLCFTLMLISLVLSTASCFRHQDEVLNSCPGSCTSIQGRLLTAGGQQNLEGATVTAIWNNNKGIFGGGTNYTKARTTTDANGNYRLTFFAKDEELQSGFFYIAFSPDPNRYYIIGEESVDFFDLKRDTTYQVADYLIPRKATVNLTVTNPRQIQNNFFVEFSSAHGVNIHSNSTPLGGGSVMFIYNQASPFTTTTEVAADQPLFFKVVKDKNGATTRSIDSLLIPVGGTHAISVTY